MMRDDFATRRRRAALALLLVGTLVAGGAGAQTPAPAMSTEVIAESPRAQIDLADYEADAARVPPDLRGDYGANRNRVVQVLNNMFANRALANEARALGLDRDPLLMRQIQLQTEKMLAQARLQKLDADTAAAFNADPGKYVARAREIYLLEPERFRVPERVHVSHLLIAVRGENEDAPAKAKAEALRDRLVAGASMADLAREFSDDPTAKTNGGDIGLLAAKDVDPAFAAAAFALTKPGELSPVVKSSLGYHVIQYRSRNPAHVVSFDDAKARLLAEVRQTLIASTRAAHETAIFNDPKPKVNEDLIDKITLGARSSVVDKPVPPAVPR
jgi:peptidyl-prolyl cis-trans isomerase C